MKTIQNPQARWAYGAGVLAAIASVLGLPIALALTDGAKVHVVPALLGFEPFTLLYLWLSYRAFTSRVVVEGRGVVIRNVLKTHELSWEEVERFELGRDLRGLVMKVHSTTGTFPAGAVAPVLKSPSQKAWLNSTIGSLEQIRASRQA